MLNFGDRLREERTRLGLNQSECAAVAEVSKTTQFNYEKGERSPDAPYLAKVAEAGIDVLYVLTGNRASLNQADLSAEEADLLNSYRSMPEGDRVAIRRMAAALAESAANASTKKSL